MAKVSVKRNRYQSINLISIKFRLLFCRFVFIFDFHNVAPSGGSGGSIQAKYDELVKYTVKLEEETLALQREKEVLEAKMGQGEFQFKLWHLLMAVILAIALSKLPAYI